MSGIISIVLYFIVGVISLLMAYKGLFSKKYLPFHEEAAGKSWDDIDKSLQYVILTILKISALGFLVMGLLMTIFPILNYFRSDIFIKYSVPIISLIYCFGLFLLNYSLYKKTKANTPWKGSIIALLVILTGFIISTF